MENRTLSPLGTGRAVCGCGRHRHIRGSASKAGIEPVGFAVDAEGSGFGGKAVVSFAFSPDGLAVVSIQSIQSTECDSFEVRTAPIVGFALKRLAFAKRAVVVHARFIQSARFSAADERALGGQKRRFVVTIRKKQSGVSVDKTFCNAHNSPAFDDS